MDTISRANERTRVGGGIVRDGTRWVATGSSVNSSKERGGTRECQAEGNDRLPAAGVATVADLEVVELGLERLDRTVRHLEVLVETVALRNKLQGISSSVPKHTLKRPQHVRAAPTA